MRGGLGGEALAEIGVGVVAPLGQIRSLLLRCRTWSFFIIAGWTAEDFRSDVLGDECFLERVGEAAVVGGGKKGQRLTDLPLIGRALDAVGGLA